nr:MAG TPA: hypothetical protein [Caudoviricetes sp.]
MGKLIYLTTAIICRIIYFSGKFFPFGKTPRNKTRSEVIIMKKLLKLLLLPRCSLGRRALASSGFAEL